MGSRAGANLWSQIVAEDSQYCDQNPQSNVEVVYRRRRPPPRDTPQLLNSDPLDSNKENRVSLVGATKRVSWNRSLSVRGRVSIAVGACVENRPQKKQAKRKGRPPVPKGKAAKPPNFEKEKEYFKEVDAFELLEESPSPKSLGTWVAGNPNGPVAIPHLSSRLEQWLISKKLNFSCEPSTTLSKLLETPAMPSGDNSVTVNLRTPAKFSLNFHSNLHSVQSRINSLLLSNYLPRRKSGSQKSTLLESLCDDGCKHIETAIKKLSFVSTSTSLDQEYLDPFTALLTFCGQTFPSTLLDVFSKYCDPDSIVKVGEGTYGEAFKAGNTVCKIVPFGGDLRVNGEVQKKSEELLEEVVLSRTLNHLRGNENDSHNACTTFIETLDLRVCQGPYKKSLVKAWEDWDEKNVSENDHPKEFPEKQCYVVFVLQHGGKDLENFVLANFDEARSLLVQVTAALAVAEAAFEFEHRDLHWGNILLSRNESARTQFVLEDKKFLIETHGLQISIIDFTLSRINTGEDILFLDLSSDPDLFKGPKRDIQAETYRKMKDVTEDSWEGSFPRTNVLWLIYLVDILLKKKSFERCSENARALRTLKKRLDKYNSAKEAIFDPFFSEMLVNT
ncbi:hypothetical protein M5689_008640 [Euphorbia peplus]|nr:hypothetical protein M5689_008640 [Euphorbia peplus]